MKRKMYVIYRTLIALLALAVAGPGPTIMHAQQSNRVGLVVRFGDGSLITRCVEFTESEISGYDLLTRSGLDIVAAFDPGQGAAVCAIEGAEGWEDRARRFLPAMHPDSDRMLQELIESWTWCIRNN